MDPVKNKRVLKYACVACGIPVESNTPASELHDRLLYKRKTQRTGAAPDTAVAKGTPTNVPSEATFLQTEAARLSASIGHPVSVNQQTNIETETARRWQLVKSNTLTGAEMMIAADRVAEFKNQLQQEGWVVVLVDKENHYFRQLVPVVAL